MKNLSIPLRVASLRSDYTSVDGEIESMNNLVAMSPAQGSGEGELERGAIMGEDSGEGKLERGAIMGEGSGEGKLEQGAIVGEVGIVLPEAPDVEFSLKKVVLPGWHPHPDILPSQIVEAGENSESGWGKKAVELLSRFETDVERHNLFFEPFLVISVLRMKDGSRIIPSPPVLMIPGSGTPVVSGSDSFGSATMKMDVVSAVCSLQYRIVIPEALRNAKDVESIDVMISKRLPLFKRKSIARSVRRFTCDNFTHCLDPAGNACEHPVTTTRIVQGWRPEATSASEIMHSIMDATEFYLVSELPFNLLHTTSEFLDLPFNCGGLAMSEAYPAYRPDYVHHSELSAAGKTIISGRTTLWDLTLVSPLPLPLSLSTPYANTPDYSPRWVFHPDPLAKYFTYAAGDEIRKVPLRSHPQLYGSYYWRGMEGADLSEKTVATFPDRETRVKRLPDGILRSGKNCPLQFPDNLLMKLDVGRVIAVCRAFRASGLVATTSPTAYAFTSEGVFLLKEMDDGTFRDSGLICRHVLRDGSSFIVKGRSIEFFTDRGETVIIDGTKVKVKDLGFSKGSAAVNNSGVALTIVDENEECGFMTRPLKLGSQLTWKQMESVRIEGNFNPSECIAILYGSPDLRHWRKIAEKNGGGITGLWAPLCRFFKVECKLNMKSNETLEGLRVSFRNR